MKKHDSIANAAVDYRPSHILDRKEYLIGKDGSVWSFHAKNRKWFKLRTYRCPSRPHSKRLYVHVWVEGKKTTMAVGPLVIGAFGDPRPPWSELAYRNGDETDNRLSNLVWAPKGTSKLGTQPEHLRGNPRGSGRKQAILDEEKVSESRRLYREGTSIADLAVRFGVGFNTMRMALSGKKNWRHVPDPIADFRTRSEWTPKGVANHSSRLDPETVAAARQAYSSGATPEDLALEFGVSDRSMRAALFGETYSYVPNPVDKRSHKEATPRGTWHPNAKLDEIDVKEIRDASIKGESIASIARRFRIDASSASAIIRKETWTHVGD
jgi:hypothetical protein